MATRHSDDRNGEATRAEIERYRRAAEETLEQVDWCIGYLHRIRKPQIARALERNRRAIRRRMSRADD